MIKDRFENVLFRSHRVIFFIQMDDLLKEDEYS